MSCILWNTKDKNKEMKQTIKNKKINVLFYFRTFFLM